jgi:hypothetical protein
LGIILLSLFAILLGDATGNQASIIDSTTVSIDLCRYGSIVVRPGEIARVRTDIGGIVIIRSRGNLRELPELDLKGE